MYSDSFILTTTLNYNVQVGMSMSTTLTSNLYHSKYVLFISLEKYLSRKSIPCVSCDLTLRFCVWQKGRTSVVVCDKKHKKTHRMHRRIECIECIDAQNAWTHIMHRRKECIDAQNAQTHSMHRRTECIKQVYAESSYHPFHATLRYMRMAKKVEPMELFVTRNTRKRIECIDAQNASSRFTPKVHIIRFMRP